MISTTKKQLKQQASISEEQNGIQKQNIKLALFDKRSIIYNKVKELIVLAISNMAFEKKDIIDFDNDCIDAYHLFEEDIYIYIKKLEEEGGKLAEFIEKEKLLEIKRKEITQVRCLNDEEFDIHKNCLDEIQKLRQWFENQQKESVKVFDSYLNIRKLGL